MLEKKKNIMVCTHMIKFVCVCVPLGWWENEFETGLVSSSLVLLAEDELSFNVKSFIECIRTLHHQGLFIMVPHGC